MSKVHNEERHPNGTPKTIDHWEDGKPVYFHEVGGLTVEELMKLGHPKSEAIAMVNEGKPASKKEAAKDNKDAATQ